MTKYTSILRTCVCLLLVSVSLSGCFGYKINVLQGNFLEQESVEQVAEGMTRNQVRYLLGTPMVADSFHEDRWDYVYQARLGKTGQILQRKVTVFFEGDLVDRVEQYGVEEIIDTTAASASQ